MVLLTGLTLKMTSKSSEFSYVISDGEDLTPSKAGLYLRVFHIYLTMNHTTSTLPSDLSWTVSDDIRLTFLNLLIEELDDPYMPDPQCFFWDEWDGLDPLTVRLEAQWLQMKKDYCDYADY